MKLGKYDFIDRDEDFEPNSPEEIAERNERIEKNFKAWVESQHWDNPDDIPKLIYPPGYVPKYPLQEPKPKKPEVEKPEGEGHPATGA